MATSGPPRIGRQLPSYSGVLRSGLIVCAVALALLPIPVTALELLPAYRVQARFLVFYAPIVCLLLLAYLFYVRDALARLMFAGILRPLPETDPYERPGMAELLTRVLRGLQTVVLALLPLVLLATSYYCVTRYSALLSESVDIAAASLAEKPGARLEADTLPAPKPARTGRGTGQRANAAKDASRSPLQDTTAVRDPAPGREEVLRTAELDDIPMFNELCALYIGSFAAALTAVVLMALKENAKEAMGLSEQDLILGPTTTVEPTN
jgi:hypothetical protein